jgi:hypothetical protein
MEIFFHVRRARAYNARRLRGGCPRPRRTIRRLAFFVQMSPERRRLSCVLTGKEMQAMYRPNFCCECGERVARASWSVWTSRRFCPSCARRLRRKRFAAPLAFAAALVATGFLFGRMARPSPPPLIVERGTVNLAPILSSDTPRQSGDGAKREDAASKPEPTYGPDGTANERPTDPGEVVYICGARTKKGTPCQRRVRGPFRCWQHRGMPAILPPSKLIVPG